VYLQEYGMTAEEKLSIARGIATPLLQKIRAGKAIFVFILDVRIMNIFRSSM
jgi:hypothetical protein